MGFLKKKNKTLNKQSSNVKLPFYKRRKWKIFFLILGIIFIVAFSFGAYLFANGSKVFNGSGSIIDIFKNTSGEDGLSGLRNDNGRINILFMGRGGDNHPGGLLTDSLMVFSYDTNTKKASLVSVPRDLLVPIKNHGQDKINSSFADGYNDYIAKKCTKKSKDDCRDGALSAGADLTSETLQNVIGTPIHYYAMIDFDGFTELVDKIGGIDILVDKAIYDPLFPDKNMKGYEPFYIKAGQHHMDGALALKYARSRETTSDFDRSRRQQQIISGIKDKTLSLGILANPKKLVDLVNIISDHTRTNLSVSETKVFVDQIKDFDKNQMITKVLSTAKDGMLISDSSTGTFYLKPKTGNFDQIKEMFKTIFEAAPGEPENANIEVLNGTTTSGLGGKVANDLKAAGYSIVNIAVSNQKFKKTTIYDYSQGKNPKTIKYLQEKYNAEVIIKNASSGVDISVIIGDDNKNFGTSKAVSLSSN